MSDGRSKRKAKVVPFIDACEKDRLKNFQNLLQRAKQLELTGFEDIDWQSPEWIVTSGRLIKSPGKNIKKSTFNFLYSPKLGGGVIPNQWDNVIKALMVLRFHRKNQNASNQRTFITAASYVAYVADSRNITYIKLVPEVLDEACAYSGPI